LIDECVHASLVGVAHAAGYEATHVNHLALSGQPDWALAERIVKDEFTFATNNRAFGNKSARTEESELRPYVTTTFPSICIFLK
jgi:hypothetical protein